MLAYSAPGDPPLPPSVLAGAIPAVVTLGFLPFVLLTAYVLRLATVARRTAAAYPFASWV